MGPVSANPSVRKGGILICKFRHQPIHKSQDQTILTSPTRAHERQPAGITHLHNDTVPTVGGDTLWASGYSAYEKLSPAFRQIIDGRYGVYRSAHAYLDRDDPQATFERGVPFGATNCG